MDLVLLSNSAHPNGYLAHGLKIIKEIAGTDPVTFIPYALADWDTYTAKVATALAPAGITVQALPTTRDAISEHLSRAPVIFAGGGNTFRLLDTLQRLDALDLIAERVTSGHARYIGSSAGTNLAGPTIATTNDMPICWPASLTALGLVPFQLNPHYLSRTDPLSTSETRDDRIREFLEENDAPVVGLYENSWMARSGDKLFVSGRARVFTRDSQDTVTDSHCNDLLNARPRYGLGRRP